jgi:hypothetical protein
MKQLLKGAALGVLFVVMAAGSVVAQGNVIEGDINRTAGSLEIPRGTTVNGNVTLNMGEIEILGVVNGNVNSNMGQVTVHGDVNGDVEANMGQVVITGNVTGSVKARMGEVIVDGVVAGDLEADLGAVRIRGTVGGDVNNGLGELRIPGEVLGSVTSRGKIVHIGGTVQGDVTLSRGIVELGPDAVVGGRVYVEQGMVKLSEGAQVGSVKVVEELTEAEIDRLFRSDGYIFRGFDGFEQIFGNVFRDIGRALGEIRFIPQVLVRDTWRILPWTPWLGWPGHVAWSLLKMIVLFALAALTFALFPKHVQAAGEALLARPGPVLGWGLLAAVLAVPLMILLAVTIIGIPLIFVEILLLALAGILGYTAISRLVGEKIVGAASTREVNPLGAIALGVLILGVVSMVPLLGGLVGLLLLVLAVGAALASRFGALQPAPALQEEPAESGSPPEEKA